MTAGLFPFDVTTLPLWVVIFALCAATAVLAGSVFFALRGSGRKKEERPPEEGPSAEL